MKKNLNFFFSTLIIAITFASPGAMHGMEDLKPDKQDLKRPCALGASSDSDITEEPLQKKRRDKELQENLFKRCPEEIKISFFKRAVVDNYFSSAHIPSLKLVCQEWHNIINKDFVDSAILSAYELGYGEIYKRFLKSELIYRPQEGSDVGMVTLPIAALKNPLEGKFDLLQCGDTGKYLSISTGYRKQRKAENANKIEIWLVPRFLIAKELNTTANHFQAIYESWEDSAEVGIFWTWGGWDKLDNYDYLTMKNADGLSIFNLYQNWQKREESGEFLFHKKVLHRIQWCAFFSYAFRGVVCKEISAER